MLENLIRETLQLEPQTEILDSHGPGQLDGWDSLGNASLVLALESTFEISIGLDELIELESVADIKELLRNKGVDGY